MFIDRAVIEVRSGKGGDGCIAFRREKFVAKGGPAGGNGGKGASIILKANSKINTLYNFRHSKCFIGPDGEKGDIKNQFGRHSKDVIVEVPVGTVVYLEENMTFLGDLNENGKELVVAVGGRGGRGNSAFKSSTNRCPRIAENGEPGETKRLVLELKLLADVGVIGFPSVGKSTLLSVLSNAKPEIADYPFTTIVPNLGVVNVDNEHSFVMADLPGLIEGAHLGKGLGLQFLRHIERCRVVVHVIDFSNNGRDEYKDYLAINEELKQYGFNLIKRPQIVVASKMDEEGAKERLARFKKKVKVDVIETSALLETGLKELIYKCFDLLQTTPTFPLYDKNSEEVLEHKVYTLEEQPKEFFIQHPELHKWVICGDSIVKFYRMTNISTDEGMMKLFTKLRKMKIDDELYKLGAQDGDTVILDDFEFEFVE